MTRKVFHLILLLVLVAPVARTAELVPTVDSEDLLQRIDRLLEKGVAENYLSSGLDLIKESLDLCLACMQEKATDYEILWRCSRAAHQYGGDGQEHRGGGLEDDLQGMGQERNGDR